METVPDTFVSSLPICEIGVICGQTAIFDDKVAEELEQAADERWLWKDKHHAKLIDGFT